MIRTKPWAIVRAKSVHGILIIITTALIKLQPLAHARAKVALRADQLRACHLSGGKHVVAPLAGAMTRLFSKLRTAG